MLTGGSLMSMTAISLCAAPVDPLPTNITLSSSLAFTEFLIIFRASSLNSDIWHALLIPVECVFA